MFDGREEADAKDSYKAVIVVSPLTHPGIIKHGLELRSQWKEVFLSAWLAILQYKIREHRISIVGWNSTVCRGHNIKSINLLVRPEWYLPTFSFMIFSCLWLLFSYYLHSGSALQSKRPRSNQSEKPRVSASSQVFGTQNRKSKVEEFYVKNLATLFNPAFSTAI